MIIDLELENFLFINKGSMEFSDGLNVITGETGAGKSILLEGIKLVLGKKGKSGAVLKGKSSARVQANFKISPSTQVYELLGQSGFLNEEDPQNLSISRTFKAEGSEKTHINGILANLSLLKELGKSLIEIHGQNEHQTLLDGKTQKQLLDRFCGENHIDNLLELRKVFNQRKKIFEKIEELEKRLKDGSERLERLEEVLEDLKKLDLSTPDEEEKIKDEAKKLQNAEEIAACLDSAGSLLSGTEGSSGLIDQSKRARDALRKIANYDPNFAQIAERLDQIFNEAKDLEREISVEVSNSVFDPEKISEIQERLNKIGRMCRKYSCTTEGLFLLKVETEKEISELSTPDITRNGLMKEKDEINIVFFHLLDEISKTRKKAGDKLQKMVMKEMEDLGFSKAQFEVLITPTSEGAEGQESIDFVATLNPGAPPGSLKKIASGGELSRIALAIKRVLATSDEIPTLIFDEIDTGIGGETAEAVAKSLENLSRKKQVILVTHLHQIAKEGSRHFTVSKSVEKDETSVRIDRVAGKQRELEIARMLGDTGKNGLLFARSILKE
ncbi:MAG: DNA repair protein RecN [Candidatus Riflebacteria bacterium]|nr:DNA repair protein RecN [Candidatus Riflebacteria bacterium]